MPKPKPKSNHWRRTPPKRYKRISAECHDRMKAWTAQMEADYAEAESMNLPLLDNKAGDQLPYPFTEADGKKIAKAIAACLINMGKLSPMYTKKNYTRMFWITAIFAYHDKSKIHDHDSKMRMLKSDWVWEVLANHGIGEFEHDSRYD